MDTPLVTVILPIRNEAAFIAQSLGAVTAQEYPPHAMEIFVVDGGSVDATLDIIRSLPDVERVHVLANRAGRQAAGMNAALRHAHGDIIIRVDGHTIVAPDYVQQCVNALGTTGASTVGGRMQPAGTTCTGLAIAAVSCTRFAVPTAFHVSARAQFTDTVYMGAWPRTVLEALGGFDEHLVANEDYELNYRIRRAGGKVYLSPILRSTYYCRQTLRDLARQYFQYGIGKQQVLRKHPGSLRPRQLVAPSFVAFVIFALLLAPISTMAATALLLVVGLYGLLTLAFSVRAARVAGWSLFWRIVAAYMTIHVAWGVGFWAGMWHRRARPLASRVLSNERQVTQDV